MGCGQFGRAGHEKHYCSECSVLSHLCAGLNCGPAHVGCNFTPIEQQHIEPVENKSIISDVALVNLNVNIWQGKKALSESDIIANGVDGSKLPPAALASLGSKRIVSPAKVAPFNVLKRQAAKECARYGVRFGSSGYIIQKSKVADVNARLAELQSKFRTTTEEFTKEYEEAVEEWCASNPPEWTPVIKRSADSVDHVKKSLSFKFSIMEIAPSPDALDALDEEMDSLYGQLAHEIRVMAKTAFDVSLKDVIVASRGALRPINAIREKLDSLSILHPGISTIIGTIDSTLQTVNTLSGKTGPIAGPALLMLQGLASNVLMRFGIEPEESVATEEEIVPIEEIEEITEGSKNANTTECIEWDF